MFYSPTSGGFYVPGLHASIPDDAIAITAAEHQALLAGQAAGSVITADADGRPRLTSAPAPTREQQLASHERHIQTRLDDCARTRGYQDLTTAISYQTSAVPTWSTDATHLAALRDATWTAWHTLLASLPDDDAIPSWDAIAATLPPMPWP